MRIWSIQLDDGSRLSFDLDALELADQVQLLIDSIDNKIVVGHNLAFDFTWLVALTNRRDLAPALVLDTMLIARCIKPASVYVLHRNAVGDATAQRIIRSLGTNASVSLGALSYAYGLGEAEKTWQHPRNWAVSPLCSGHHDYVLEDIDAPLQLLRIWTDTRGLPFSQTLEQLRSMDARRGGSYFDIYAKVPMSLALISHTGMPLHAPTVAIVRERKSAELEVLVEQVISLMPTIADVVANDSALSSESKQRLLDYVADSLAPAPSKPKSGSKTKKAWEPETPAQAVARRTGALAKFSNTKLFEVFRPKLEARASAVIAPMKLALAVYADINGCELDDSEDGMPVINAKAAKLKGLTKLEGWVSWERLQGAKKLLALCDEYQSVASADGIGGFRLRPLFSARTATARVAAQAPNVMNLPRPAQMPESWMPESPKAARVDAWNAVQFRAVVRAPDGYVLISADYGQIELRIASALALRAIRDAMSALAGDIAVPASKNWFLDALRAGADLMREIPADDQLDDFGKFTAKVSRLWRRLMTSDTRPLADAFRANVDPHLLTGITLAAQQGLIDLEGVHPIEFLKLQSSDEIKELKKRFSSQRQSAKALNFGLLYGMQSEKLWIHGIVDYSLSWTLEEAVASRVAWFDLFPEIEFLQSWNTLMLMPSKKATEPLFRKNPYSKLLHVEDVRIGASSTLRGRPVVATEAREVLNYSDQGTGADMLLEAVTTMSRQAFDCIIDLIHDEILLCVPLPLADDVQTELERAMLASADRVLAPWCIPAEAEGARMLFWKKD
jgi:DNA polymerase-1